MIALGFIVGVSLLCLSLIFALLNMKGMASSRGDFEEGFNRHIFAMIGLVIGGGIVLLSVIMLVLSHLH